MSSCKTSWGRPARNRPAGRLPADHDDATRPKGTVGLQPGADGWSPMRARTKQGAPPLSRGRAWCAVVLSHASRPIPHASLVQPAKHASVGYPVQRVPEAPIRGVEDDGPAWAQMTPPVRVGTYELSIRPRLTRRTSDGRRRGSILWTVIRSTRPWWSRRPGCRQAGSRSHRASSSGWSMHRASHLVRCRGRR